jgi:hypothetical protein
VISETLPLKSMPLLPLVRILAQVSMQPPDEKTP